jgi:large repetitive protein
MIARARGAAEGANGEGKSSVAQITSGPACAVLAVPVALAFATCSPALADRAFTPRFSTNTSGDVAIVGNTLETCPSAAANCLNARAGRGSALDNNNFVMERVDIDPTMVDSSSARLDLPAGARVLFAGLYYGGRTSAGTGGKAAPNTTATALRTVDFKPSDATAFERLTGALDESTDVKGAYAVFVDVTARPKRSRSPMTARAPPPASTSRARLTLPPR